MGFTSVFLWYECGYVIDMGDFSENRDLIYSPINDYRKLPEMWSQVLQSAEELWYQEVPLAQRSDDSSIRNPRSSINLWEYERKLIREFENLKAGSCKQQIESLWTKMNQERVPMDKVKHTIISIDQILSKISQFPQTHKDAIEYCSSHEQLRLLFSDLVEQYMSFWMNNRYCVLSDHPQINQTIAYIQHHYQLNLTVRSLAKLVSMDETYLSNLFKKKAGTTIIKYIHRLRIDRSILLLEQFDHPIHEIAESVGFDDHNYFNRVFKRYTGMSPGDYRKQHNQRLLS
jgi:YesN/AraC family two-component response regulator